MTISFPTNTRDVINGIRTAIGRTIILQDFDRTICTYSGCGVDPITDTAIDPFCPVCSGVGYTTVMNETSILAHVFWKPADMLNWVTGGQYFTGDCVVQVEYTDTNIASINDAKYVVVDDKRLRIKDKVLRGVPAINRVILDLELEEE